MEKIVLVNIFFSIFFFAISCFFQSKFFFCHHNFTILDNLLKFTKVTTSQVALCSCIMKIKKTSYEMKVQQRR